MQTVKNKIIFHCCGGAGINIGDRVLSDISELGEGFADIDINYIDTSKSNIANVKHNQDKFTLITANDHSNATIEGSGGERVKHATAIKEGTINYLNDNNIFSPVVNEYHIIVASASGGTGNMIGVFLLDALLKKNIPVVVTLVGDSTNALFAKNTAKSLATLHNMAIANKRAVIVLYVNNHNYVEEHGVGKAEEMANKVIFNTVSTLAMFLSGQNESIDAQDMANLINQTNYVSLDVKPGLYGLGTFSRNVSLPDNVIPTVSRTLALEKGKKDINIKPTLHSKTGIIKNQNAIDVFKNQAPIHLVAYANLFISENEELNRMIAEYDELASKIKVADLATAGDVDTETGIVY